MWECVLSLYEFGVRSSMQDRQIGSYRTTWIKTTRYLVSQSTDKKWRIITCGLKIRLHRMSQVVLRRQRTNEIQNWTSTSVVGGGRIYTHADSTSTHRSNLIDTRLRVRLPTLNFTSGWVADSSDFGLLGSNVPRNGRFPAQDADEPPCKIWRR